MLYFFRCGSTFIAFYPFSRFTWKITCFMLSMHISDFHGKQRLIAPKCGNLSFQTHTTVDWIIQICFNLLIQVCNLSMIVCFSSLDLDSQRDVTLGGDSLLVEKSNFYHKDLLASSKAVTRELIQYVGEVSTFWSAAHQGFSIVLVVYVFWKVLTSIREEQV